MANGTVRKLFGLGGSTGTLPVPQATRAQQELGVPDIQQALPRANALEVIEPIETIQTPSVRNPLGAQGTQAPSRSGTTSTRSRESLEPVVDFRKDPVTAVGLVLRNIGAGLQGETGLLPTERLRAQQVKKRQVAIQEAAQRLQFLGRSLNTGVPPSAETEKLLPGITADYLGQLGRNVVALHQFADIFGEPGVGAEALSFCALTSEGARDIQNCVAENAPKILDQKARNLAPSIVAKLRQIEQHARALGHLKDRDPLGGADDIRQLNDFLAADSPELVEQGILLTSLESKLLGHDEVQKQAAGLMTPSKTLAALQKTALEAELKETQPDLVSEFRTDPETKTRQLVIVDRNNPSREPVTVDVGEAAEEKPTKAMVDVALAMKAEGVDISQFDLFTPKIKSAMAKIDVPTAKKLTRPRTDPFHLSIKEIDGNHVMVATDKSDPSIINTHIIGPVDDEIRVSELNFGLKLRAEGRPLPEGYTRTERDFLMGLSQEEAQQLRDERGISFIRDPETGIESFVIGGTSSRNRLGLETLLDRMAAKRIDEAAPKAIKAAQTQNLVERNMRRLERLGPNVVGVRGALVRMFGGFAEQFMGEDFARRFARHIQGVDIEDSAEFRADMRQLIAKMIPTVSGEMGDRFSEPERQITEDLIAAFVAAKSATEVMATMRSLRNLTVLDKYLAEAQMGAHVATNEEPETIDALAARLHVEFGYRLPKDIANPSAVDARRRTEVRELATAIADGVVEIARIQALRRKAEGELLRNRRGARPRLRTPAPTAP